MQEYIKGQEKAVQGQISAGLERQGHAHESSTVHMNDNAKQDSK